MRPGGRIVLVEPYCSAVSTPLYRRFHHERTDLGVDPFAPDPALGAAMEGNQALPTLAFFRHAAELTRRWEERIAPEVRPARIAPGGQERRHPRRALPALLNEPIENVHRGIRGICHPQAIHVIFVQPEHGAGHEKAAHFIAAVVVDVSVPVGMKTAAPVGMFEEMRPVKVREAVRIGWKV